MTTQTAKKFDDAKDLIRRLRNSSFDFDVNAENQDGQRDAAVSSLLRELLNQDLDTRSFIQERLMTVAKERLEKSRAQLRQELEEDP